MNEREKKKLQNFIVHRDCGKVEAKDRERKWNISIVWRFINKIITK